MLLSDLMAVFGIRTDLEIASYRALRSSLPVVRGGRRAPLIVPRSRFEFVGEAGAGRVRFVFVTRAR